MLLWHAHYEVMHGVLQLLRSRLLLLRCPSQGFYLLILACRCLGTWQDEHIDGIASFWVKQIKPKTQELPT